MTNSVKSHPPTNSVRAVEGLDTYRFRGRFGYIYAGARSVEEALQEVRRSTSGTVSVENLEVLEDNEFRTAAVFN